MTTYQKANRRAGQKRRRIEAERAENKADGIKFEVERSHPEWNDTEEFFSLEEAEDHGRDGGPYSEFTITRTDADGSEHDVTPSE